VRHLLDYVNGYEIYHAESAAHAVIMAYCANNGIFAYDVKSYIEENISKVTIGKISVAYKDYSCRKD
jgi:hypothetical protein